MAYIIVKAILIEVILKIIKWLDMELYKEIDLSIKGDYKMEGRNKENSNGSKIKIKTCLEVLV